MRAIPIISVIAFSSVGGICFAQNKVSDVWLERSARTTSIHLKWDLQSSHYRLKSKKIETYGEFACDNSGVPMKWRFDVLNLWDMPNEEFSTNRSVSTVDGTGEQTTFFSNPTGKYPVASIQAGMARVNHLRLLAISILYFPFDSKGLSLSPSDLNSPVPVKFNGLNCDVFQFGDFNLWVEKESGHFIPIRLTRDWDPGLLRYDFQIQATINTDGMPVMKSWSFDHLSADGEFAIESTHVKVTSCEVNQPVGPELFNQTPFPHGTWVNDNVRDQKYLARSDGPNRILEKGHTVHDYDALMATDNGTDIRRVAPSRARKWIIWGNLAAITLIGALLAWKRWRRPIS